MLNPNFDLSAAVDIDKLKSQKDLNWAEQIKVMEMWINNNPLEYENLVSQVRNTQYSFCFHGLNPDGSPILTLESPFTINRGSTLSTKVSDYKNGDES